MRRSIAGRSGLLAAALLLAPAAVAAQREGPARLGTIHFPTSAGPKAQHLFELGVLWMHSFEYDSAQAAFRAAQVAEPGFALAYWGEAMTYNHPVWNQRDEPAARAALSRLGPTPAARAARAGTARERAWLRAAEVLWAEGPKAVRDTLYAAEMAVIARDFPDDEADAFHALAILGLSQGARDVPAYVRAGKIALDLFRRSPEHPGAAHYVIHAFDDPVHAILGRNAAVAYSRIAPDAGHAQHMTTHIFLALGMWDEVSRQNVVAMQAASGSRDSLAWPPGHYTWWLAYSRLQQGRWDDARRYLEAQHAGMAADAPRQGRTFTNYLRDEYLVTTHDWTSPLAGWADVASPRIVATHLFRALAASDRNDGATIARAAEAVAALRKSEPNDTLVGLTAPQILALALKERGQPDSALAVLRAAAAFEAGLPMDFGPPGVLRPVHEALAEALLATGHPGEARAAFERALARTPGRSRTLAGLAVAARLAGDSAGSARARRALERNFHAADPGTLERLLATIPRGPAPAVGAGSGSSRP